MKWSITDLKLDVDAVLRGQGADPVILRKRKPRLVDIAANALDIGIDLLRPQVISRELKVGVLNMKN